MKGPSPAPLSRVQMWPQWGLSPHGRMHPKYLIGIVREYMVILEELREEGEEKIILKKRSPPVTFMI